MTTEAQIWTLIDLGSSTSSDAELRALRDRLRRMIKADPESPRSAVWAWLLGLAEGSRGMDSQARMSRASVHLRRRTAKGAIESGEPLSRRQQLRVFDREVHALASELDSRDVADDSPDEPFGLRSVDDHHIIELTARGNVRWHLCRRKARVVGPLERLIHEVHPGPTRIDYVDGIRSTTLFVAQSLGQPGESGRAHESEPALLRVDPIPRPTYGRGSGTMLAYSFMMHYDESRPKFGGRFDIPLHGCLSVILKLTDGSTRVVRFQEFDIERLRTLDVSDVEVNQGAASYFVEATDCPLALFVYLSPRNS